MAEHDEVYDQARADRLADLLRALANRILELDRQGKLLGGGPELIQMMGDARSELFHYEVRSTYDTPEVADSRRIVEDDVVIYAGATILGRITLGRGSSIGGNVWLTRSVPPGTRVTQGQAERSDIGKIPT